MGSVVSFAQIRTIKSSRRNTGASTSKAKYTTSQSDTSQKFYCAFGIPSGSARTRLFTVSMSTCLERVPLTGQGAVAGIMPIFVFTEQQSDIHFSSSHLIAHTRKKLLLGGLLRLRRKTRIRCCFHERIRVGFCTVEGHQNLL